MQKSFLRTQSELSSVLGSWASEKIHKVPVLWKATPSGVDRQETLGEVLYLGQHRVYEHTEQGSSLRLWIRVCGSHTD